MSDRATRFYAAALTTLAEARVDFLVGGGFAYALYTGITRDGKDCDVFVRPRDCPRALDALAAAGYRTEMKFPHWLGKAHCGDDAIDVIFSSGNGVATVDDLWFVHAVRAVMLDRPVRLSPVEEMIWSKAFIMERERYDGADIAHLLHARAARLDWPRLLARFGPHWRVLLSHLVLFGFIYPGQRHHVPPVVMRELMGRLATELGSGGAEGRRVCQGTLLSRAQYLPDVEDLGYEDARLEPRGELTADDVELWTAAIEGQRPRAA